MAKRQPTETITYEIKELNDLKVKRVIEKNRNLQRKNKTIRK